METSRNEAIFSKLSVTSKENFTSRIDPRNCTILLCLKNNQIFISKRAFQLVCQFFQISIDNIEVSKLHFFTLDIFLVFRLSTRTLHNFQKLTLHFFNCNFLGELSWILQVFLASRFSEVFWNLKGRGPQKFIRNKNIFWPQRLKRLQNLEKVSIQFFFQVFYSPRPTFQEFN